MRTFTCIGTMLAWIAVPAIIAGAAAQTGRESIHRGIPIRYERDDLPVLEAAPGVEYPDYFDWREMGGVTPAKDQLDCGSCWLFASVGQLEAHMRIYDGILEDLSEQQIMNCNSRSGDCGGLNPGRAYEVMSSTGVVRESCAPYLARDHYTCPIMGYPCEHVGFIHDYYFVEGDVNSIKEALQVGPVVTAMGLTPLMDYCTGGCCNPDGPETGGHYVLIVGWDDNACNGSGAWIIKNSWSETWGVFGFGYIEYGYMNIGVPAYQINYRQNPVYVGVDAPGGGEVLLTGSDYTIRWTTGRAVPDSLTVLFLTGGAAEPGQVIASGITGADSCTWHVPDLQTDDARIKVIAWLGGEHGGYNFSDGSFTITSQTGVADTGDDGSGTPAGRKALLEQNYPNPFNGTTTIAYSIDEACDVRVAIFDPAGRIVRTLEDGKREPGRHQVIWNGVDGNGVPVASGLFLCRITAGKRNEARKILYLR